MNGRTTKSVVAENMRAALPNIQVRKKMAAQKKMCWSCQNEKSTAGGLLKMFTGGPLKFVCKDCVDARAARKVAA